MTASPRCAFCAIELEPAVTGRPPAFCSKRCRQHDYRERRGLVRLGVYRRARRRRDALFAAELDRLLVTGEGALGTWSRQNAHEEAWQRSWKAWPSPAASDIWESFVAALWPGESSPAIARDETGDSSP